MGAVSQRANDDHEVEPFVDQIREPHRASLSSAQYQDP
jgi:hypothetical protein